MRKLFERLFHAIVNCYVFCGIVADFLVHRAHTRWYLWRLCHMPKQRRMPYAVKRCASTSGWAFVHRGMVSKALRVSSRATADDCTRAEHFEKDCPAD